MRSALLLSRSSIPVILTALVAATPAAAVSPPDVVYVTGVVRDFHASHADFDKIPAGGPGHYAGAVDLLLPADGRPVLSGAGFKVADEWTNGAGFPIAPHLYRQGGTQIQVANPSAAPGGGGSIFDTWDSAAGPYGGPNVGPAPTWDVGATMPEIVVPWSLQQLPNQGNLVYNGNATFSSNFHCNVLNLGGGGSPDFIIDGNVSILCEGQLFISTQAKIKLNPGARLTLYLMAGTASWNHVEINVPPTSGDPSRVTIYNLSAQEIFMHNQAKVYATLISPNGPVHLNQNGEFFGTFVALEADLENNCNFHWDSALPRNSCGVNLNDVEGTRGVASTGGITSSATFDQWYRDVLGVNLSSYHSISLVRGGDGVYEYLEPLFYPIDGLLFGNEGQSHNRNFTYEVDLQFVYRACTSQFFQFTGDDTCFVYVDGVLGIDLGGIEPAEGQLVEMDRLNLVDGREYTMHFLYAHRYGAASFHMRTNVEMIDVTRFLASAPVD